MGEASLAKLAQPLVSRSFCLLELGDFLQRAIIFSIEQEKLLFRTKP